MKICIDPGHGKGNDAPNKYAPGATGHGIEEAAFALMLGLQVKAELVRRGHTVVMTRTSQDAQAPLTGRSALGAGCGAFLSIHCNAAESPQAHGVEVISENAAMMAVRLSRAVSGALGLADRGRKRDTRGLAVIKGARCPACLLELGFISNAQDAAALSDTGKRGGLITAICDAITA